MTDPDFALLLCLSFLLGWYWPEIRRWIRERWGR
jgi:hypothetical protein